MISVIGWIGTLLYLLNHAYISLAKNAKKPLYYLINFIAAASLMVQSINLHTWQTFVINGFWMILSLCLLLRMDFSRFRVKKKLFYGTLLVLFIYAACVALNQGLFQSFEALAWTSSLCFCVSYFLFTANGISQRHYLSFNTYSAVALLPSLYINENWPIFALEITWAVISLWGIIKSYDEVHLID